MSKKRHVSRWVLGQLPPRKIAPNPKTNSNSNLTLTGGNLLRGQLSGCVPTLKLTLTLTQTPTLTGEQFPSGENCLDTESMIPFFLLYRDAVVSQ